MGPLQHAGDRNAAGALDQVTGGACGVQLVLRQNGLVALYPLQQGLFAVIVRHQRNVFARAAIVRVVNSISVSFANRGCATDY